MSNLGRSPQRTPEEERWNQAEFTSAKGPHGNPSSVEIPWRPNFIIKIRKRKRKSSPCPALDGASLVGRIQKSDAEGEGEI